MNIKKIHDIFSEKESAFLKRKSSDSLNDNNDKNILTLEKLPNDTKNAGFDPIKILSMHPTELTKYEKNEINNYKSIYFIGNS